MTRAVVFLAVAMVAASLGVIAQSDSGSSSQVSTQPPAMTTASSAQSPAGHDSTSSTATRPPDNGVQNTAQAGGSSAEVNNGELPQTSTILPLLGLLGLGSLVAGFFARR